MANELARSGSGLEAKVRVTNWVAHERKVAKAPRTLLPQPQASGPYDAAQTDHDAAKISKEPGTESGFKDAIPPGTMLSWGGRGGWNSERESPKRLLEPGPTGSRILKRLNIYPEMREAV